MKAVESSVVTPVATPLVKIERLPVTLAAGGKRKLWKRIAIVIVLLALAGGGTWYYYSRQPTTGYLTETVDRGNIESIVTTTGNLNAVITVQVGSQVSGDIKALYADFNTKVKKGQLVALIDPAPFQAAADQATATLNSAKAAVLTARASLAKSQSDLTSAQANVASQKANVVKAQSAVDLAKVETDRRRVLIAQGATSQEDFDTAKANFDQAAASVDAAKAALSAAQASADSGQEAIAVAQAQLQQAEATAQQAAAALAQAQLNLNHTRIVAPVDGTVESRNMDVGQTVAASFQAPTIFVIAQDLTKMQVDTNVGEADVAAVRLDQKANFTVDAYPGQIFTGRVAQIRQAPINVQNVITYDVVIAVANPDLKLFPGMTANATIFTSHVSNVIRIPKAALRFHLRAAPAANATHAPSASDTGQGQMQIVYKLDRGQPQAVRVKLGVGDQNYVQLADGAVQEHDQLVVGMKGTGAAPAAQTQGGARRVGF